MSVFARVLSFSLSILAAQSALAQDFNGDGYDDHAVGVPGEDLGSAIDCGAVNIFYGSASGLTASGSQFVSQATRGVAEDPEDYDRFGDALAWGDFNKDGYDDLAMGAPGESVGAAVGAGAVHVFFGSAAGLTTAGSQLITQDSLDVPDAAEATDRFGSALVGGYFDGDLYADLAVGVPGEDLSVADAGAVILLKGSPTGLSGTGSQIWHQDSPGILEVAEAGDNFGYALARGNFDGSGMWDLAVGVPFEDLGRGNTITGAGLVHVLLSDGTGLTAAGNQIWSQSSSGIQDVVETNDRFGIELAAGDFNHNGWYDLAIGIRGENTGGLAESGAVAVLFGTVGGLGATGNQLWSQDSSGIAGSASANDYFGASLVAADFDSINGPRDLVIGVYGESLSGAVNCGALHALYGGSSGLTSSGSQLVTQNSSGIQGTAEDGDGFGFSFGAGDFNGDGRMDLVVGVPFESVGAAQDCGGINVIYGSASGLTSAGDQFFSQDTAGVPNAAESWDHFGYRLLR